LAWAHSRLATWRIVLNRTRRGVAGSHTNVLPVGSEKDHSSSLDVCSRQGSPQGGNLWTVGSRLRRRDLLKTADRQHEAHLREMIIACVFGWSILQLACIAYGSSLTYVLCYFHLLINICIKLRLIVVNAKYPTQFERISSSISQSGFA